MNPVTDLTVHAVSLVGENTHIDFSFTKPTDTDGTIGGYYLYGSSTGLLYFFLDGKTDASHRKDLDISTWDDFDGYTHFEYTLSDPTYQGRILYFYIEAVSTLLEPSIPSNIVAVSSYPQIPDNFFCLYDSYETDLSWDSIDFIDGRNSDFSHYSIYKNYMVDVYNTTMTDTVLYNTDFTVGKAVWIRDTFKKSDWFGEITTEGEFDLEDSKRTEYSASYDDSILDNFQIKLEADSDVLFANTTSTGFVDTYFTKRDFILYKLQSVTSTGAVSSFAKFPVYCYELTDISPYLRQPLNSSTGLLNNEYWVKLKNALIGNTYYEKGTFSVPYSATETFNFKGFLGVSRCLVDFYLHGIYHSTTSTGIHGEFEFNHLFPKGETQIYIQARDRDNVVFSQISGTYSIKTLNIYTAYSIWGDQYKAVNNEATAMISDLDFSKIRYSSFTDQIQPLIELYKYADEDTDDFITMSYEIFRMFEYVSYDESLYILLDAIKAATANFDHYELYFNNRYFRTSRTGFDYVHRFYDRYTDVEGGVFRSKYYYGVTSLTSTGEESDATIILVDDRSWPVYRDINVLMWDYVPHIPLYNIYRGTSPDDLYFVDTASGNVYIDYGTFNPDPMKAPPAYNFTDYDPPSTVSRYINTKFTHVDMFFRNRYYLQILLYAVDNTTIPQYQLDRILFYLKKVIPPELKYTVIVSNDTSVQQIHPLGSAVDLSQPQIYYAVYDISLFDNAEVYS